MSTPDAVCTNLTRFNIGSMSYLTVAFAMFVGDKSFPGQLLSWGLKLSLSQLVQPAGSSANPPGKLGISQLGVEYLAQ